MMADTLEGVRSRPYALWATGFTRRWHQNPELSHLDDLTCAHQGRCALLVMAIFPDHSLDLLRAAVTHDAGERWVGDLSAPFKRVGGPLIKQHAQLEEEILAKIGFGFVLGYFDAQRLQLVDKLDAYLFVQLRAPDVLKRNGWVEAFQWILEEAEALDCRELVRDCILDGQARLF